jgi:hypothetical protein
VRNTCPILIRKSEEKGPLGRPRYRWKDIKTDHKEITYESLDWINLWIGNNGGLF